MFEMKLKLLVKILVIAQEIYKEIIYCSYCYTQLLILGRVKRFRKLKYLFHDLAGMIT